MTRIGTLRFADWHDAYAAVTYSADGTLLAGVDGAGRIDIWNVKAGTRQSSFGPMRKAPPPDRPGRVAEASQPFWHTFVAFSPDGKALLTGSDRWPVRLWDVQARRQLCNMEGTAGGVLALAVAPDFKTVAAALRYGSGGGPAPESDGQVSLWDVSTGNRLRGWKAHNRAVRSLAWSQDGKALASGGDDGRLCLWDPATGRLTRKLTGCDGGVTSVAYSPDDRMVASADRGRNLALWDLRGGDEPTRRWHMDVSRDGPEVPAGRPPLGALFFTPDGKRLVSHDIPGGYVVDVWEVPSGKRTWQFTVNAIFSPCCAVSPDGTALATVDRCLWDLATGQARFAAPGSRVEDLRFLPDGRTLLTNDVGLWDAATGARLRRLYFRGPSAVAPDGQSFAEWEEEAITLRDLATRKELCSLPMKRPLSWCPLVFTPDGRTLAAFQQLPATPKRSALNTAIRLWDVTTGKEGRAIRLDLFPQRVSDIVFSADGRLVAGLGYWEDNERPLWRDYNGPRAPCFVWDRADVHLLRTLDLGRAPPNRYYAGRKIAFSPDGRVLASFGDIGCHLWEVVSGQRLLRLTDEVADAATFSPDGRLLAWACRQPQDGRYVIHLTDTVTGQQLHPLTGHLDWVSALAFSPDGKRLASGSADRTALVWDLADVQAQKERPAVELTAKDVRALWADLQGNEAAKARAAVETLARDPEQAVTFLDARRAEWTKSAEQEGEKAMRLMAEVDDDDFGVRERATGALQAAGPRVLPWVIKHLRYGRMSLDARRRLEGVRDALAECEPEGPGVERGLIRATEVLERVGTPEARAVLESLTKGIPEGRLTREAMAALERLARRAAKS